MGFGRLLPPYYKLAIFWFCGLELIVGAFLMSINQKFWDLASKIFPIAFRMFNDTLLKGVQEFGWTETELQQLNRYENKLKLMWVSSTFLVLYSMICIVPQFCTVEEPDGRETTYPKIGYVMGPILLILIFSTGVILTWQWATCEDDYQLFQKLFFKSQKEEAFLSEIEQQLNCNSDDDKEIDSNYVCNVIIIELFRIAKTQ